MRGKGLLLLSVPVRSGITPAYAGKSKILATNSKIFKGSPPPMRGKVSFASCSFASFRDHPRLCGEKPKMRVLQMPVTGSPPPMRGKDWEQYNDLILDRITPAYAGKRKAILELRRCGKDHPRLCGEKEMKSSPISSPIGSPPPMRGKD